MTFTGVPAALFLIPFFIGACICLAAGLAAGAYIVARITDWIINRLILRYYVYSDFLTLVRTSAIKRHNKENP